ncbi:hypothetical protein V6N13_088187 [Hibiscus sabdariffa]
MILRSAFAVSLNCVSQHPAPTVVRVLCNLWIQRNTAIFENQTEEWVLLITRSRWLTDTTREALTKRPFRPTHGRVHQQLSSHWLPPPVGCFKVNNDGACKGLNGRASCGGLIRNHLDCAEAIKLIHHDDRLGGSLIIVRYIREFFKKDWCLSYICINRVSNSVADALATTDNSTDLRLLEFEEPPDFILPGCFFCSKFISI